MCPPAGCSRAVNFVNKLSTDHLLEKSKKRESTEHRCLNSMLLDGVWLKALQKSIEAYLLAKTVLQGSALKPASAREGSCKKHHPYNQSEY